ncbi:MAG: hypothetical protein V3T31_03880 [candidate division Zixibacteria bacterium]
MSTYHGIIVAADSRITSQVGKKTRVSSEFCEKIVRLGSHASACFSGTAHLINSESHLRSISSLIGQYKSNAKLTDSTHADPQVLALGLDSMLTSLYNQNLKNVLRGQLTIFVCGYDKSNERRVYELQYPRRAESDASKVTIKGKVDTISQTPSSWILGQYDTYARLIKGYDHTLSKHKWFRSVEVITIDSFDSTKADTAVVEEQLNLDDFGYDIRYDLMTLQDAIDFAVFIVRATIEAQRFNQLSVQGVGGAIDIAVITPDGFKWIQHKQLHGEGSL